VNEVNFQKFVAQKLHWLSFAQIVSLILYENEFEKKLPLKEKNRRRFGKNNFTATSPCSSC
jgi:hypothetical protein